MSKVYINNAFSPSMLSNGTHKIIMDVWEMNINSEEFMAKIISQTPYLNQINCWDPSHENSLNAFLSKFKSISIPPSEKGAKINLEMGDRLFIITPIGLPRETREFTDEEIEKASFKLTHIYIES